MFTAAAFVVFCIACAVLAFRSHPIFGLYFYMASTYVHPPSRWWGYMLPDLRWALLSAGITVLAVMLHRGKLNPKPIWLSTTPALILFLYTLWMCLQSIWALELPVHLEGVDKIVKYMVGFWFVYRVTDRKEALRNMLLVHVLGCGLLGMYARMTGRDGDGRLDGVGGPGIDDANTLGMYLATGVIIGIGLFLTLRGWRRWLLVPVMLVTLDGFILANSRGALLGLVAGAAVITFCKAPAYRRMFWSIAAVAVMGFVVVVDEVFIERMFTISDVVAEDEQGDQSARSRMVIYQAQIRMAIDYPLGAGYRGTATLSPRYMDSKWLTAGTETTEAARSSHNTFMTTLVEQGVPGALMFIVLVGWLLTVMVRVRLMNRRSLDPELTTLGGTICAGLVVVLVAGSAADYLLAEIQFWLFAGLASMMHLSTEPAATAEVSTPPAKLAHAES